jgi:hypothetical protein
MDQPAILTERVTRGPSGKKTIGTNRKSPLLYAGGFSVWETYEAVAQGVIVIVADSATEAVPAAVL